jgi:hypothetical protein
MSKKHNDSKVTILLSIDRSEHMVNQVLAGDNKAEITSHLQPYIDEGSVLCIDGAHAYEEIAKVTQCRINGSSVPKIELLTRFIIFRQLIVP